MVEPTTKQGKHGTLYLYELAYTDRDDDCCPEFTERVWRYSLEHVQFAWDESSRADGWTLLRAARVPKEGGMHRATQHRMAP